METAQRMVDEYWETKKEDTTERAGGVNNNSGLSPTDDVSIGIIPHSAKKKQQYFRK